MQSGSSNSKALITSHSPFRLPRFRDILYVCIHYTAIFSLDSRLRSKCFSLLLPVPQGRTRKCKHSDFFLRQVVDVCICGCVCVCVFVCVFVCGVRVCVGRRTSLWSGAPTTRGAHYRGQQGAAGYVPLGGHDSGRRPPPLWGQHHGPAPRHHRGSLLRQRVSSTISASCLESGGGGDGGGEAAKNKNKNNKTERKKNNYVSFVQKQGNCLSARYHQTYPSPPITCL